MVRTTWLLLASLASLSSVGLVGCAPEDGGDDVDEGAGAIAEGTATSERSSTVGQLIYLREKQNGARQQNYCTATLVAPDVVLTAGKCLAFSQWLWGDTDAPVYGSFFLGTTLDLRKPIVPNVRDFAVVGPTEDDAPTDETLVLVRLTAPVEGGRPATLATALPSRGDSTTVYGYGCDGTKWDDGGVLRKTTVKWGSLFGSSAACDKGDHGAPLFDAAGQLVGVVTNDGSHRMVLGRDVIVPIPATDDTNHGDAIAEILAGWSRR